MCIGLCDGEDEMRLMMLERPRLSMTESTIVRSRTIREGRDK